VRELHALLNGAGIKGPYVLVGHSYGARVARVFAKKYPDAVAGMALIDPGTLDDDPRFPPENRARLASDARMVAFARWLAPFGVVRVLLPPDDHDDRPMQQQAVSHAFSVTPTFFQTVADQQRAMPLTYAQEHEVTSLGSMPLIVVSSTTPDDAIRRVWTGINGELAALSTNSIHRVVEGATHMGLVYKREHAQVTLDAIRQVVEAVRHGQPLGTRYPPYVSNSMFAD
jgi:pimeloyl-ACP methyl ester carboxylesterase